MKSSVRTFSFIIVGGLLGAAILVFWTIRSFSVAYAIQTSANARPGEVTFLRLQEYASQIGYWRDGINCWAEFNIPESDFRILFDKHKFTEITRAQVLETMSFGNTNVFPMNTHASDVEITNGLKFVERWDNGGGYEIFYNRADARAYYRFNKR